MVLHGLLSLDAGEEPNLWVSKPRFHHQYVPDEIQHEPDAFGEADRRSLEKKGHQLSLVPDGFGNMQAIYWDRKENEVQAASDPRGVGKAQVR